MFTRLIFVSTCLCVCNVFANHADVFNELQTVLRTKRDVLGEGNYECYSNGECVMEYKSGQLLTYREEPLCSRSEEGCGVSISERKRREAACGAMSEEFEQLCVRSSSESCSFMKRSMEEMECGASGFHQERTLREKREECLAVRKRFEQLCSRATRKRAITEECSFALEEMESSDCGDYKDEEELEKRETCADGWTLHEGICYRYFAGPLSWSDAEAQCASLTDDESSHLATLERAIARSTEDRAFFSSLIESSGAIDKIDAVLSTMSDHYNGSDWKEVVTYLDNWTYIGVKKIDDEWRWVSAKKEESDWNDLKNGQSDWYTEEPTDEGSTDIRMDHGDCVTYFQPDGESIDHGAWWNVDCEVELPFLCERDPQ